MRRPQDHRKSPAFGARSAPRSLAFALALLLLLGLTACACNGCHNTPSASSVGGSGSDRGAALGAPSLRLYLLSDLAGALEPCGCTKDQLGGIDHLAAYLASQNTVAPASVLLAAGPTLFLDPRLLPDRAAQDKWKAEAIGASLGDLNLAAWTPGYNDWAAGEGALAEYARAARGTLLGANLAGATAGAAKSIVRTVGGYAVGIIGVGAPSLDGSAPGGVTIEDATAALTREIGVVRAGGAKILVALSAMPRGDALRLVDRVPDLDVLLVGKPSDAGEANTVAPRPNSSPRRWWSKLRTTSRPWACSTSSCATTTFASRTRPAWARPTASPRFHRIADLSTRVSAWEKDPAVSPADLATRRADLASSSTKRRRSMRRSLRRRAASSATPSSTCARARARTRVDARILDYYKRVNEHNKVAFADRVPRRAEAGSRATSASTRAPTATTTRARSGTRPPHATAYPTLQKGFKEYNLDCVSCHVTGYDKPGGSTVTHNAKLQDVQCETCHGPGSLHAKDPKKKGLIEAKPKLDTCTSSCHHPPHVEGFDAASAKYRVLGPGHGMPDDAPWPAWAKDAKKAKEGSPGAAGSAIPPPPGRRSSGWGAYALESASITVSFRRSAGYHPRGMSGRRYRIVPLVGALGLLGLGCGSSGGSGSCSFTTTDAGDAGTDAGYSTANDPKNCGACGHDCRGGACSAGVCQPVPLVMGFGAPPASSLGWSHPQRIAVDGENVYVTRLDTIDSIPVLGNKLTTVVSTPSAPQALTLDATHLYFTMAASARRALKTPTDAGSMQLYSVGQTLGAGVAVDDTNVYWAASGAISFAPLAAKSGTPLATAQSSPFAVALDDTNVYFTDFGGGRVGAAAGDGAVMSVPKAGGTATALSTASGPYDIAVNAHGVFWIEVGATDADGAVMKTSPAGDPVTLGVVAKSPGRPRGRRGQRLFHGGRIGLEGPGLGGKRARYARNGAAQSTSRRGGRDERLLDCHGQSQARFREQQRDARCQVRRRAYTRDPRWP